MEGYCDYGCGCIAKYVLRNGKLCGAEIITKCPAIRIKNSIGNKGKIHTKEAREKMSMALKGIMIKKEIYKNEK